MENQFLFCTSVLLRLVHPESAFSGHHDSENAGLKRWRKRKMVFSFVPLLFSGTEPQKQRYQQTFCMGIRQCMSGTKCKKFFFFVPCWYDSKSRTDAFLSDAGSGTEAVSKMENCFLFYTSQIWQILVILLVWNGGWNAKRLSVLYHFC